MTVSIFSIETREKKQNIQQPGLKTLSLQPQIIILQGEPDAMRSYTETAVLEDAGKAIPLTAIPLVSKFEILERLLEETCADQESTLVIQIKTKSGRQTSTEAFLDSGSELSFISESLYTHLMTSEDDDTHEATTADTPTTNAEGPGILLSWSKGDNSLYAESEFCISPSSLPADIILGHQSLKLGKIFDRRIFRSCFQRLRLWAADISDQTASPDAPVGHVLQVLEDSQAGESGLERLVHNSFDTMLQSIKAIRAMMDPTLTPPQPHKIYQEEVGVEIEKLSHAFSRLGGLVESIRKVFTTALERQEPPRGNTILSFDGGGIRSYSSILILRALMYEIESATREMEDTTCGSLKSMQKDSLARDFFDYMFGVSSGGLLAIMFGRLRMSVPRSLSSFEKYSAAILDHPRRFSSFVGVPGSKYSTKIVEAAIQDCVKVEGPDSTRSWKRDVFVTPGDPCKSGVFTRRSTSNEQNNSQYLFRTYRSDKETQPLSTITQIARAAIAIPTVLTPVTVNGFSFSDGGFGTNNPSFSALREVLDITKAATKTEHNSARPKPAVSVLVSIGTGKRGNQSSYRVPKPFRGSRDLKNIVGLLSSARTLLTDAENVHQELLSTLPLMVEGQIQYFRFNVEVGLENTLLGSPPRSKTASILEAISRATNDYLKSEEVKDNLRKCAKALVMARRYRTPPKIIPVPVYQTSSGPSDLATVLLSKDKTRT